ARALREMQLGKGRSDALRGMAERSNVEDLQAFVGAMVQAEAFGISIGQVLRVQSGEMRTKRRQYAEAKAQQVPVKIMVPLILFILPCLFIVVMGPAAISAYDAFTGG
ncbi:MAG: type II secretion system F family protein, partial [Nocardioidaceae bacterium]|nr:type II secretion system F family protein [Nocardioidaceae bacterium]